jgi:hypothetical protein
VNSTELDQSAFDSAKSRYQSEPSQSNFSKLWETKPSAEIAYVTEVLYEVAARELFALPILPNLVETLIPEGRFQEARFFCEKWLEQEPTNPEALRLACILACKRMDRLGADKSFQALLNAGANAGVLWMLETIMILAFTDGRNAIELALQMLSTVPRDPIAPHVALDVAFRTKSARVLVSALDADPSLEADPRNIKKFGPFFKVQLVGILRFRRGSLGNAS